MNKYRPGGRCGGDSTKGSPGSSGSSGSPVNSEFNSSLAALMAQRDMQDALWVGPTSQDKTEVKPEIKPDAKHEVKPDAKHEIKNQIVVKPTSKPNNDAYIQMILEGDYEE